MLVLEQSTRVATVASYPRMHLIWMVGKPLFVTTNTIRTNSSSEVNMQDSHYCDTII